MNQYTEQGENAEANFRHDNPTNMQEQLGGSQQTRPEGSAGLDLPEIPATEGLDLDLSAIIGSSSDLSGVPSASLDKVTKRQSNVQKLAMENEKLKAELKAMSDRLEAAEKRKQELAEKQRQRDMS